VQIDLYTQCTGCSNDLFREKGDWWSSKGSVPNPPIGSAFGFLPAPFVFGYLNDQFDQGFIQWFDKDPISCFALNYVGDPDCICSQTQEYGCGENDIH
jgi:hypothetical protein